MSRDLAGENQILFARLRAGDARAADELCRLNLALVKSLALRLSSISGLELDELIGAGSLGLCKAIESFDDTRGVAFSTYAVPVIAGEMKRLLRDGGPVKVSRALKERGVKLRRAERELSASLGRSPGIEELARATGLCPDEVVEALDAARTPASFDEEAEEGGSLFERFGREDPGLDPERLALRQALRTLPPRDAALISLRYFGGYSQAQTAARLSLSQVQVSRREKKLLHQLRAILT